ncbi:helix-turn-helix domain-containing protein, partial [bacterium D16-59]
MDNQPVNNEIEKFVQLSKNEKDGKQKKRYDAVLLYLEGRSRREISEILHIPRRTVSGYISLYTEGGAEALLIRKQP